MSDKIYFKGLNGIRAIACSTVIISHIDIYLYLFGAKELGYSKAGMAGYGVILFFVLSGFLITYLMLTEKKQFGRVELVKFYKRRILRIWPVYYAIIVLTALFAGLGIIAPIAKTFQTFTLYSLLCSNVGFALSLGAMTIYPLWSVGVEEQFYAFWPLLLNNSRKILHSLLWIIAIYIVLKIFLRFFENGTMYSLIGLSAFDSMAIGGVCAYWVFNSSKLLQWIYHPLVLVPAWLFMGISVFYRPVHVASLFDNEIHSVVYAILIVNVSTNPSSLVKLENKVLNFIGRISYGLYMYHMTIIALLLFFFRKKIALINNDIGRYGVIFSLVIGLSVILSYLSYEYFESKFLRLKIKFSNIGSTNEKE